MLDVRHLFGSLVKPFSLNQITRITQKSKNEVILVYNRDGLRGDRLLRLSETDMKDFMNELLQRNPAIEIFASNS
jgi:DNA-directed RNA polymerase specialized sigma54-like protein